jgi:hypothetical protein
VPGCRPAARRDGTRKGKVRLAAGVGGNDELD